MRDARKGLEFPLVALPGVGHMPAREQDEKEAARVFYVAVTRASQRLVMGVGGNCDDLLSYFCNAPSVKLSSINL